MRLFRKEKKEKLDIEFVTKTKPKELDFKLDKKNLGRSREELIRTIPDNTSRAEIRWLLQVPFDGGTEAYFVFGNSPTMTRHVDHVSFNNQSYGGVHRQEWNNLYVEFRDYHDGRRLTEWLNNTAETVTGRQNYGGGYKKNITLEMIDPTGMVIESWHMVGCFPVEIRHHQETIGGEPVIGVEFSIDNVVFNR